MTSSNTAPIDWLLQGPAFVRYRTLIDLAGKSPNDPRVKSAYDEMLGDPLVARLVAEANQWEEQYPITRHNNAKHLLHKLVFAADIGINREELKPAITAILAHQSPEGPFQIRIVVPKVFGGDDTPKWDWVATDAPLILFALLSMGIANNKVMKGVNHIRSRINEPGFPCFASNSMGRFRGPGRKGDPCPYANLIILRMLAEDKKLRLGAEAEEAVSMLLHHWQVRGQQKYYLFGIGTDFAKPKAPLIWYDILHFTDTLSRFPFAIKDKRFREVIELLESKADKEGRLTSESVWMRWKGWEFCQKKEPSYWLTFLFHRILARLERANPG